MTDHSLLEKPIKMVLVGDPYVGKSSLIQSYALDEFSTMYLPTTLDNYKCGEIMRSGNSGSQTFNAFLMDVSSREDYARMRESIYKSVDVVLFCFSLSNIEMSGITSHYNKDGSKEPKQAKKRGSSSHISLGNVKTIWLPELEKALGKEQPNDDQPEEKKGKRELPIKILVGTKSDQLFENAD